MARLKDEEIATVLENNPAWRLEGTGLVRDFIFQDFVQAIAFVNRVADVAERQGHHPDITIRYNGVRLDLVSHDEGGVTQRDTNLLALLE